MAKTILLTCSDAGSLRNFRGELIEQMRADGHRVVAVAPSFPEVVRRWCAERSVTMEVTSLDSQGLNPLQDAAALVGLYRIIRRHRPDVVMGYTHKPAIYTALAGKLAGVPHVTIMVTGLGFGFEPGEGRLRRLVPPITRALFRASCAASDRVIFHNRDNYDYFVREGLLADPAKGLVVGGSGVNLERFPPLPLPETKPGALTFLLIARMVRYKGILEFAQAANALKQRYPQARFLVAGYRDSNPLAYPTEEWREIERSVDYVGPVVDVQPLYRRAHVYVLPSYGEGMPRTVLEAMASGRPIITTDTYGCRDTVEEEVNGHLVPVRDWRALAGAMEKFLSSQSSVSEMAAASLERARRMFDVRTVNRDMLCALGLEGQPVRR